MKHVNRLILWCAGLGLMIALAMGAGAASPAAAQTDPTVTATPTNGDAPAIPLMHEIQSGETLFTIAAQYGTTVETLQQLNNISDPSVIYVGQLLRIPGEGETPFPTIYSVEAGDTLALISEKFNTTPESLGQANRLLNPNHLVVGQPLGVSSRTGTTEPQPVQGQPYVVQAGDTLTQIGSRFGLSPAEIARLNGLPFPTYLFRGQRLRLPGDSTFQDLPGGWQTVRLDPLPLRQGESLSIYVEHSEDGAPTGSFDWQQLRFLPYESGYLAMVGWDAFAESRLRTLVLEGGGQQPWVPYFQDVRLYPVDYGSQELTLTGETASLLDPVLVTVELELLEELYTQFTPEQYWEGLFQIPVSPTLPTSAGYGIARSYNGGPYSSFHSGTDFAGPEGVPVFAPNNGVVRFAEAAVVRGNIVIIDHGLGVMSGFYHLSQIDVVAGQAVSKGELIGEIGSTGLSTGPHLHWDIRIMNVAVAPLQWTEQLFP